VGDLGVGGDNIKADLTWILWNVWTGFRLR